MAMGRRPSYGTLKAGAGGSVVNSSKSSGPAAMVPVSPGRPSPLALPTRHAHHVAAVHANGPGIAVAVAGAGLPGDMARTGEVLPAGLHVRTGR